jgi:pimeloyl-ACP methyl ester carboxylesterase
MEIEHNGSVLFYERYGTGKKTMLLFHGFAQDHSAFSELVSTLDSEYTFYSFDLFFHGKSRWIQSQHPIEKHDWLLFLENFMKKEGIQSYSALGFSIGARLALVTAELFPKLISEVILVAPDGVRTNFWYGLATHSRLTRRVFKSLIHHPKRFHNILSAVTSAGLLKPQVAKFAATQMESVEQRSRVYSTWVALRKLKVDWETLATASVQRFTVILGNRDRIITLRSLQPVLSKLPRCTVVILNAGHGQLLKNLPRELEKIRITAQNDSQP